MEEGAAPLHPDIDRGWAWVVVAAIFVYNCMVGGTMKTFGLFYVEFIHWFPEDGPAKVGLIGLSLGITSLVMAPLGGILGDYIQRRWIALVGGIVMAASFAGTAFAQHLVVAIITFGCLAGGTLGLIDGPILASLGCYFRRKRNIASGLAWTGGSAGGLIMAPLFSWLIKEYGIRGSVVLLGGIWLHTCVIGLLLRPLPKASKMEREFSHVQVEDDTKNTTPNGLIKMEDILGASNVSVSTVSLPGHQRIAQNDMEIIDGEMLPVDGAAQGEQFIDGPHAELLNQPLRDTVTPPQYKSGIKQRQHGNTEELLIQNLQRDNEQHKEQLTGTHKLEQGDINSRGSCQSMTGYLCFLRNSRMWRTLLVLGCGFFGYYVPFTLIPLWSEELLISKSQVAWIISLISLIEILFRILLGVVIDSCRLRADWVLVISYVLIGITGQIVFLVPSFWALIGYGCVHGMMGGVAHVVMATMVGQVVKMDRIGSAMGLVVMQLNLASASATFISGLVKEVTGSYSHALQLSSGAYLTGAALYTLGPIMCTLVHKICQPRTQQEAGIKS